MFVERTSPAAGTNNQTCKWAIDKFIEGGAESDSRLVVKGGQMRRAAITRVCVNEGETAALAIGRRHCSRDHPSAWFDSSGSLLCQLDVPDRRSDSEPRAAASLHPIEENEHT